MLPYAPSRMYWLRNQLHTQCSGVVLFQHNSDVFGNRLLTIEILGDVELRQVSNFDFF